MAPPRRNATRAAIRLGSSLAAAVGKQPLGCRPPHALSNGQGFSVLPVARALHGEGRVSPMVLGLSVGKPCEGPLVGEFPAEVRVKPVEPHPLAKFSPLWRE